MDSNDYFETKESGKLIIILGFATLCGRFFPFTLYLNSIELLEHITKERLLDEKWRLLFLCKVGNTCFLEKDNP